MGSSIFSKVKVDVRPARYTFRFSMKHIAIVKNPILLGNLVTAIRIGRGLFPVINVLYDILGTFVSNCK